MNSKDYKLYGLLLLMGIISSIMIFLNSMLARYTNLYVGGLLVHLIGFVPAVILFIWFDCRNLHRWKEIFQEQPYLLSSGLMGAVMIVISAFCINNVGVFLTTISMTVGQFFISLLIDIKGYFGFQKIRLDFTKIVAIFLIGIGSIMISV